MKILLIYPPVSIFGGGGVGPHIPMGLAYLAGYLNKLGHEVEIIDALAEGLKRVKVDGEYTRIGLSDKQIEGRIKKFNPDMVGISIMFSAFVDDGIRMAKIAKKVNINIKTVVGGAHVSIEPEVMVKNKYIDFAVQGEGEWVLGSLVDCLENKKKLKDVAGVIYKIGSKIVKNKRPLMINNLDDLPFPAFEKFKLELYDTKNVFNMRRPLVSLVTSRGCPNHCVYCSIHSVWEHKWRGRSAENVVDEIEYVMKKFGVAEVAFQDDSMSVDKIRMRKICQLMIDRKLDIKWTTPNGIAHWTLDKKLLDLMKKAGCYRITFGIESGNPEMRRWIGKPFSLEQARELTAYANRIGMWTLATNIIGLPYETEKEIEDTINYAIKSDVDMAFFFRLGPRKGTPVYEIFKKEGWLPKDEKLLYSENVNCDTMHIKNGRLFEIQNKAYKAFIKARVLSFLNPTRILNKIRNREDLFYVSRMGMESWKMLIRLVLTKSGVTSKSLRV